MTYIFREIDAATGVATGREEHYLADNAEQATQYCLYTARLKDSNATASTEAHLVRTGGRVFQLRRKTK
jgi:hypothetical protein